MPGFGPITVNGTGGADWWLPDAVRQGYFGGGDSFTEGHIARLQDFFNRAGLANRRNQGPANQQVPGADSQGFNGFDLSSLFGGGEPSTLSNTLFALQLLSAGREQGGSLFSGISTGEK